MKIIGLTGGSGTGKSTAAALLREQGAGWVDADAVYRTLCAENREMLHKLDAAFGGVLDESGALDRVTLARIVFSDPQKLALLNALTLPYIRAASEAAFAACARQGFALVLYDAPTLFEAGGDAWCDCTVGVIAARDVRIRRVMQRDGLTEEAAAARIDAQPDEAFYRAKCTYILENNGDLAELRQKADALYTILTKGV